MIIFRFKLRCTALIQVAACALVAASAAYAQDQPTTALAAFKRLPEERRTNVIRIEGRNGALAPSEWQFIVHDPQSVSGLREYIVDAAGGVKESETSETASPSAATEVLPPALMKLDSDEALKRLQEQVGARGIDFTKISYVLRKEGPDAAPVWKLTCLDDADRSVATVTLLAVDGTVVAQSGFTPIVVPPEEAAKDAAFLAQTDKAAAAQAPSGAAEPVAENADGNVVSQPSESRPPVAKKKTASSSKKAPPAAKASSKRSSSTTRKRPQSPAAKTAANGVKLENFFTGEAPGR